MPPYEIRIVKYDVKQEKETNFSLQKIKDAIANDKELRFVEKIDLYLDNNGNENFTSHAIEFYDCGTWELLCIYHIATKQLSVFGRKYESDDEAKEKIHTIALTLEATLIGEEGEVYEIDKFL